MQYAWYCYENKVIGVESAKKPDRGTQGERNAAVGINLDGLICGGKIY